MKDSLLNKINVMSKGEIYDAIYRDHLTGALNRRALEEVSFTRVAFVDLDSLKWINDNLGHDTGNKMLLILSKALIIYFGGDNVYRLGGDEFAVTCEKEKCFSIIPKLTVLQYKLNFFSFGVGKDLKEADESLNKNKRVRENTGKRASRGIAPPWIPTLTNVASYRQ